MRSCDRLLRRLDDPGREHAPLLHPGEQRVDVLAARQRPGKDVRGGNRVLDREIDADAADRRHRVRRIADREQAGPAASASAGRAITVSSLT